MDGLVTKVAHHQGLSSADSHRFDPSWSFFSPFFEISERANMVNFNVFP